MNIEEENDQHVTPTDFRPDGLVSSPSLYMYDVQLSDAIYIAIPVMCVVKIDSSSSRNQHLEAILKEGVVEFFSHPPANENEPAFLLVKTTDALMTVLRTMFGILRLQESQLRKTCKSIYTQRWYRIFITSIHSIHSIHIIHTSRVHHFHEAFENFLYHFLIKRIQFVVQRGFVDLVLTRNLQYSHPHLRPSQANS